MTPAVAFVTLSAVCGSVALWPARGRLGAIAYVILAFPLGLLAWPFAAAITNLIGVPLQGAGLALGALLPLASFAGLHLLLRGEGRTCSRLSAFAPLIALIPPGVGAWLAGLVGRTYVTADSYFGYEALGIWLHDTGAFSVRLASERLPLVTSIHSVHRALGGDWPQAVYPVIGAYVAALVAWILWEKVFADVRIAARVTASVLLTGMLATTAIFALQSFYVHSHMLSAGYLLASVAALIQGGERQSRAAWFWVAGLAVAGFVLARPDGFAYALIPVVLFASGRLRESPPNAASFMAPLWGVLGVVLGSAFATLGVWESAKLSGKTALAMLAVLAAASALGAFARGILPRRLRVPAAPILIAGALTGLAIAAVVARDWAAASKQIGIVYQNLLFHGGHGKVFWAFAAGTLVALVLPRRDERARQEAAAEHLSWTLPAGYAIWQFLAVAFVVHLLSHPGHLGWSDSFSRVAFHVVPLVFVFLGTLVAGPLGVLLPARSSGPR